MPKISPIVQDVRSSPTSSIKRMIKELAIQGKSMIRFDTIETNFETPHNVKKATIEAINHNFTKYTSYSGIDELKEAVREMLWKKYSLVYGQDETLISCGSKHALYNGIFATISPSEEAIIFAPYWMTYSEQVKMARGRPVVVNTSEANFFRPTLSNIESALSNNTKLLIINSPCNPTGMVFDEKTLEDIAQIALRNDLWVASDESMATLAYEPHKHIPLASLDSRIKQNVLTVGSVSKDYSMSGFRIGFICGLRDAIAAMANFQAQCTANPVSFAQIGATEAWAGPQDSILRTKQELKMRKESMETWLGKLDGISNTSGQGAVFLFPNFSSYLDKNYNGQPVKDIDGLAKIFMENGVAVVPGTMFGNYYRHYLRFSYSAVNLSEIEEGMKRISLVLKKCEVSPHQARLNAE